MEGMNPLLRARQKALLACATQTLLTLGASDMLQRFERIAVLDQLDGFVQELELQITAERDSLGDPAAFSPGLRHEDLMEEAGRLLKLSQALRRESVSDWPSMAARLYALTAQLVGRLALHLASEQRLKAWDGSAPAPGDAASWLESRASARLVRATLDVAEGRVLAGMSRSCTPRELVQTIQAVARHAGAAGAERAMEIVRQHAPPHHWDLVSASRAPLPDTVS